MRRWINKSKEERKKEQDHEEEDIVDVIESKSKTQVQNVDQLSQSTRGGTVRTNIKGFDWDNLSQVISSSSQMSEATKQLLETLRNDIAKVEQQLKEQK